MIVYAIVANFRFNEYQQLRAAAEMASPDAA